MQNKKYQITLEQEVLSEVCEGILADFFKLLKEKNIDLKNTSNMYVRIYRNMCKIKEQIIGSKYDTLEELKKVEGYFIYTKKFIEEVEKYYE